MQKILKFRYFFILLFLLGCGDKKPNKTPTGTSDASDTSTEINAQTKNKVIVFFGDSLTAGYQLDPQQAFPAIIQEKIDSLQWGYTVINAGLSGETTSGGLNRIDWILNQKTDVFILELGANDGLRGIPLSETKENLQSMIDIVQSRNEETRIILTGMQIPPNLGQEYTAEFSQIFITLAEENQLPLIPFLLEGVAGNPELNLADGIHPNIEGHRIVAGNVWKTLESVIRP
ncbi:MAG: arylesterase [Flavobacteriaceae bacterium]